MCECQALHPDPDDEDSENDFEGEEYDVEEAGESLTHSLNLTHKLFSLVTLTDMLSSTQSEFNCMDSYCRSSSVERWKCCGEIH